MSKNKNRRSFIETSIKASIAWPLLGSTLYSCAPKSTDIKSSTTIKKLSILILGGTSFLGPHQIAYALDRGHTVSTFTRGKSLPTVHQELFTQVEQLIGDRKDNLTALHNRKWDVVIDNSGHDANWTKDTAQLLKDSCDLYLYTSSTGVFYPYLGEDFKEEDEVLLEEPEGITDEETKTEYWYGVMKANSEQEAIKAFGKDRTIIVRPTYMIGPADKSHRFIHWPIRLSKGGEVLVPGKPNDPVQYADVRDVAEWMIRLIEEKNTGTYNAVGPSTNQNMYDFVQEAATAFDVASTFTKIDDYTFLAEQNIHYIVPWIMPTGNNAGSAKINNDKAKANGLNFRSLQQSVKDTYDWWTSGNVTQEIRDKVELNIDSVLSREKELLKIWKKQK